MDSKSALAAFNDFYLTQLVSVVDDPEKIDDEGFWVVAQTFELDFRGFKFAKRTAGQVPPELYDNKSSIQIGKWDSSLTQEEYEAGVSSIRSDIARGWVYQVNLCRVLQTNIGEQFLDPIALFVHLQKHNPAPYAGALRVYEHNVAITGASPELFFSQSGQTIMSRPIKGTARTADELLPKDFAENVMIVDLVRNDISFVADPGTVTVPKLLAVEEHPGLVHLVSDVAGVARTDTTLAQIFTALAPAGSVSGAPKSSALEVIKRLEKTQRGIYCGGFGWVDPVEVRGEISVGIRTFWQERTDAGVLLKFGTGAGITFDSDPTHEWEETKLKSAKLMKALSDFLEDH